MRSRGTRGLLVAVAAAALLASCAIPGFGNEETEDPTDAGTSWEPDEDATMPTEIPSWLLECGGDDKGERDESLQLSTLDLTQATWSMPDGYTEASGYIEDNPVETLHSNWVAEPTDPPMPRLNVLSLVLYTGVDWGDLADGCGRVPLEAVEEKLARYRDQIAAESLGDAEMTTLAGLPAIRQEIGLSSYDYTGWWLFSEDQLLHLYCQWTAERYRDEIVAGCEAVAASLVVPGA
ncbi:hypothetical protein [Pseudactinotalea sp.]|uniref:hypothetical protein n=1 Tax=Pseudactinotalea sp. TaxID=1926260 RepID=UPI003B3B016E